MTNTVRDRDRVWAVIANYGDRATFKVVDIREKLREDKYEKPPTDDVIRATLDAAEDCEIVSKDPDSPKWQKLPYRGADDEPGLGELFG